MAHSGTPPINVTSAPADAINTLFDQPATCSKLISHTSWTATPRRRRFRPRPRGLFWIDLRDLVFRRKPNVHLHGGELALAFQTFV
jgi:hypothetical protein